MIVVSSSCSERKTGFEDHGKKAEDESRARRCDNMLVVEEISKMTDIMRDCGRGEELKRAATGDPHLVRVTTTAQPRRAEPHPTILRRGMWISRSV